MTLPRVAYFSMEMAIDQSLHIYSGGLGFLAGSHMLSAGQMDLPMVGVTVLWSYGYGDQELGADGKVDIVYRKREYPFLHDLNLLVDMQIYGKPVKVKVYKLDPSTFGTVPVYLLSTDIPENPPEVQAYTHTLYDGDQRVRIAQEMILGIGGVRALQEAHEPFSVIHLNEGHALPAVFELIQQHGGHLDKVRQHTVFTTHTPVAAGNETHNVHLLAEAGFFVDTSVQEAMQLGGEEFSLTVAALRLSRIANGVSQLHGQVANNMWNWVNGRCPIIAITNAVNLHYWQDHRVQQLNGADGSAYRRLKRQMKEELFEIVAKQTSKQLDPDVLTIVWARRFTEYKRPGLIFMDEPRVKKLLEEKQVQLIFAGKFHPKDTGGRELFNMVLEKSQQLPGIAVMTGYELELSGYLKRGSDIWLNTPLRPLEASGTSGMSANMNASIHVSIYDGWAVEGTYHRHNGFIINEAGSEDYLPVEDRHRQDYDAMMDMLENELIPMYYNDPYRWAEVMRRSVQSASAYFHSDRMAVEYFTRLYKPVFL